jgi:hypothetical protein
MEVSVEVEIAKTKEQVWQAITDIDHCMGMISGILAVEILHRPESGLVGLKWQETRMMFGKEASEIMWITDAVENQFYCTRAESHGSIYLTRMAVRDNGDGQSMLTMSFNGQGQSIMVKVLSALMSPFMKASMKKMLLDDLNQIKTFVEKRNK